MAVSLDPAARLAEVRRLARERGGKCLTRTPVAGLDPVELECGAGHRWTTAARNAAGGSWCPVCRYGRADALTHLAELVRARGGVLLSKTYDPMAVRVRCGLGHEWVTRGGRLREGTWCPNCSHRRTIEEMQQLAASLGGRCVSRRYDGNYDQLTWSCAEGHTFTLTPQVVQRGQWCPECRRARSTVSRALELVEERGGTLLSRGKLLAKRPLQLRCAHGHTWTALARSLVAGHWCRTCSRRETTIEVLHELAAELGGRCVSRTYRDRAELMTWECAEGHRFKRRALDIRRGRWCLECQRDRGPIGRARRIAGDRGGELLTRVFTDSRQKLRWRCKAGHEWRAPVQTILGGSWCARCAVRRLGIDEMQRMARQWAGRCLSQEYVRSTIPLQWRCSRRHEFWRAPSLMRKNDTFCPVCDAKARREQARADAKDRR